MQTPKKEVHFSFFGYCWIVYKCFWQLMFDKKQKSYIKRICLVIDDAVFDWKAFHKVEIIFIHYIWLGNVFLVLSWLLWPKKYTLMCRECPKY